jgi:hypothetical protein
MEGGFRAVTKLNLLCSARTGRTVWLSPCNRRSSSHIFSPWGTTYPVCAAPTITWRAYTPLTSATGPIGAPLPALRQAPFLKKTKPQCSRRSNLVKGRPPHSPRTKCPSLREPLRPAPRSVQSSVVLSHRDRTRSTSRRSLSIAYWLLGLPPVLPSARSGQMMPRDS